MSMNSRAIAQRSIARQDNAPQDTSLLWLDTTTDPASLKQYNSSESAWEPVASSVVTKQDTAPSNPKDGDLWLDLGTNPYVLHYYESATSQWVSTNDFNTQINKPPVFDGSGGSIYSAGQLANTQNDKTIQINCLVREVDYYVSNVDNYSNPSTVRVYGFNNSLLREAKIPKLTEDSDSGTWSIFAYVTKIEVSGSGGSNCRVDDVRMGAV